MQTSCRQPSDRLSEPFGRLCIHVAALRACRVSAAAPPPVAAAREQRANRRPEAIQRVAPIRIGASRKHAQPLT
ncbi:hypothetical protein BSIN_0364 [Burkholderia singularis]|uniref:Uncharacterized protein n=1 Tax=Burkholderia singularis TaxID=1503053 RepID=A0A238H671_9BURK|nr:hypothetical protein BSIN_0364 [Burkholderia singularis]